MAKEEDRPLEDSAAVLSRLAKEEYCYLTTTGRVTGRPHEIEIWFGISGGKLYVLSGGREKSDWVKNLRAQPTVTLKIGKRRLAGQARFRLDLAEEERARRLLAAKYEGWQEGQPLSEWAQTALPVAIELTGQADAGQ